MELFVRKYTDKGGRDNNEDSVGISESTFVLADGLGGHKSGEIASQLVVDYLIKNYSRINDISNAKMHGIINELNGIVCDAKETNSSLGDMASTVVAAFVKDGIFNYFNVGDSRLYYFRNNKIILQSKDHSVTQACVDLGEIKREEMRFHKDRNKLTKVIGLDRNLKVLNSFNPIEVQCDDAILMCSDGFWEYISEKDMEKTLKKSKSTQQWLELMLKIVNTHIKKNSDNLSAIVVLVK